MTCSSWPTCDSAENHTLVVTTTFMGAQTETWCTKTFHTCGELPGAAFFKSGRKSLFAYWLDYCFVCFLGIRLICCRLAWAKVRASQDEFQTTIECRMN